MNMRSAFLLLVAVCVVTGCGGTPTPAAVPGPDWLAVDDFLYQLQRARPDRIGETAFDLIVVSIAAAGSSDAVIPALKNSPGGDKIGLCYMSIGQTEKYRFYWNPDWP